jgi:hypothetical protein
LDKFSGSRGERLVKRLEEKEFRLASPADDSGRLIYEVSRTPRSFVRWVGVSGISGANSQKGKRNA